MSHELNGKVAAVTGAASGIGLECAKVMLKAGARVVLIDRAEDKLAALCAELGPNAIPLVIDLATPASVASMMPQILAQAGSLFTRIGRTALAPNSRIIAPFFNLEIVEEVDGAARNRQVGGGSAS